MGFTKLDEGILRSSIMAEPPETFKVWIAILASCDPDGVARVSSLYLARACYLTLDSVDNAITTLEAPDPRSRSLNDEGRRIRRVDGGYEVINYTKYREFTYSMNPEAVRKREYRKSVSEGHFGTCPGHSASASASSSKEKNKTGYTFDPLVGSTPKDVDKLIRKAHEKNLKSFDCLKEDK